MPLRRDLEVREAPAEAEEWATSANAPSRNAGPPCNEWVEHSARSKSPYYFSSSHSFLQLLAIIFFCSLCSFTFFIYFFFFSSIRTHFAQGSLVAILSLISCIQLILLFFSFFPYTHTHTHTHVIIMHVISIVHSIVSSLAIFRFRTIIRTNRSFLLFFLFLLLLPLFFFSSLRLDSPSRRRRIEGSEDSHRFISFLPPIPFFFLSLHSSHIVSLSQL